LHEELLHFFQRWIQAHCLSTLPFPYYFPVKRYLGCS
jgi:hypothetical protein